MKKLLLQPLLTPRTRLKGRSLVAARLLALGAAGASLVMFLVALPARASYLAQIADAAVPILIRDSNLSPELVVRVASFYPVIGLTLEIGVMALYCAMAALIYAYRSEEWLALLTLAALVSFAMHIIPTLNTLMVTNPAYLIPGILLKSIGLGLAFLFLYLFPGGYYAPGWIRLFVWGWIVWVILWLRNPQSNISFQDPFGISVPGFVLLLGWWTIGIVSQIYRYYWVSGPLERQQTKYITFGAAIVLLGYLAYVPMREAMPSLSRPEIAVTLFNLVAPYIYLLMIGAIPVTITISILRYRLWDIDLIIRRTLVYTLLTAILTGLYITSVIVLQEVLRLVTTGDSSLAIVVSTLGIATLFAPLRNYIQSTIDRRFFRSKYDAQKLLEQFSATSRNEVDLTQLAKNLLRVTVETLQPAYTSLWLPMQESVPVHSISNQDQTAPPGSLQAQNEKTQTTPSVEQNDERTNT